MRIVTFYYLQSLFIPPVWSPNVPCRHTCRCCIWRSPFSILDILVHITATVAHWSDSQLHVPVFFFSFFVISKCQIRRNLKSIHICCFARDYVDVLRFIWKFLLMWINLWWVCSTEDKHFCVLAFSSQYYWELTVQSLVHVTVECETLRSWLLTSMETVLLLIEGCVCLTHAVWSF